MLPRDLRNRTRFAIWTAACAATCMSGCSDPDAAATIARAEKQIKNGDHAAALDMINERLNRFEEDPASLNQAAELRLRWLRGQTRETIGREYEALHDYEHIIRTPPDADLLARAVERELALARLILNNGPPASFVGRSESPEEIAEELLIRVVERAPRSGLALDAFYELATHHARQEDSQSAETIARAMRRSFPGHPKTEAIARLLESR